jgi:phosphatidate cytidylyltransferase
MRELIVRGASGIVFLAVVFVPVFADRIFGWNSFALTLYLFSLAGSFELVRMSGKGGGARLAAMLLTTLLFAPVLADAAMNIFGRHSLFDLENAQLLTYTLVSLWAMCILVFVALIFQQDKARAILNGSLFFSVLYPVLPFLLLALSLEQSEPQYRTYLFFILLPIYVNDTFAYLTGKSLGKRKMFPVVSPKKTWEGFIGGVAGAQIVMHVVVYTQLPEYNAAIALLVTVFTFAASLLATFGDLFESKLKRLAGVKDAGKIIPGHGGVLDRVDAMLFVAPLLYVILTLILP